MKQYGKLIVKYLFEGISWGCTFLVCYCLCCHAAGAEETLALILDNFAKNAVGAIFVGIGFGTTPIVYLSSRLPMGVKVFLHFAVGMGIFYPAALYLGWIPFYPDHAARIILQFLISCVIFAVFWSFFYLFYRNEAKKINDRLKELERMQADGGKDDDKCP